VEREEGEYLIWKSTIIPYHLTFRRGVVGWEEVMVSERMNEMDEIVPGRGLFRVEVRVLRTEEEMNHCDNN
jgi:hypothetical protein